MPELSLSLAPETLAALRHIARQDDWDVQDLIRDAIRRDLLRRQRAKKAVRPDERLIAPLRALLADDLACARGWADLQQRLQGKGYALRESGGGLVLVRHPDGGKVAKASDLGYSYSRLMRRFQAPFPGHAHRYLFDRAR